MDELYREELMAVYKNPTHRGQVADPSVEVYKKNPMCGDELNLQLKIEDGKIVDAKFSGVACSVSVISSDLLLEHLKGKTVEEAKSLSKDDLLKLVGLNLTTSRVACATLVLKALEEALKKYESTNI